MALIVFKPSYRVQLRGTEIELWVSQRKLPLVCTADAMLVPVAPDLKMVFGVAKIVRDYGANAIQYEANQTAPLPPGQAFVGTGARFRYKHTALAVIFDEIKRPTSALIAQAIRNAFQQVQRKGGQSIICPDMTENLLAQPNWITEEQRSKTAEIAARTLLDALLACEGIIPLVRIWIWDPNNLPVYVRELEELSKGDMTTRQASIQAEIAAMASDEEHDWLEYGPMAEIKKVAVQAVYGDALAVPGDAICRATTPTLEREFYNHEAPATTLSTRLLERGGARLQKDLREVSDLKVGDAVITRAGDNDLFAHILHLITRPTDGFANEETIYSSVQAALELADAYGLKRIVLPHLGEGDNDYPIEPTITITLNAIEDYLGVVGRVTNLEQILVVGDGLGADGTYSRAIQRFQPSVLPIPEFAHEEH